MSHPLHDLTGPTKRALEFLARDQQADGSFLGLATRVFDDFTQAEVAPTIVPTNIVLSSLIRLPQAEAQAIKRRAANFLLQEKSGYWSFNYWLRRSDAATKEPYPDDLDDSFCALAALHEYDPTLFDGTALAKIATMLTSAEREAGGPYDMWLVPLEARQKWNTLDLVVNCNVAYFLSLQKISLPNVNAFIERAIENGSYEFPYNTVYPAIYFISRFYKGEKTPNLVDLLVTSQEPDGKWQNPLRTALALTALHNLAQDREAEVIRRGVDYLLQTQKPDGSWPVASFYYQIKTPQNTSFAGSSSLTTALCLEALQRFAVLGQPSSTQTETNRPAGTFRTTVTDAIEEGVKHTVRQRFLSCGPELREQATKLSEHLLNGELGRQITLLPSFFRAALGESGRNVPDELLMCLGAANVFGWMAYTAYDDFLDGEGDAAFLSPANVCLRTSAELFQHAVRTETGFADLSRRVFDLIDSANSWEVAQTRQRTGSLPDYGDYQQLANRSLGHALGPLAILFSLGSDETSAEVQGIRKFFEHYLIARQLDDDAHDWPEDLDHFQTNAVAARIARDASLDCAGLYATSRDTLHQVFWQTSIEGVCEDIEKHISLAKEALAGVLIVTQPTLLLQALVPIERSVEKARHERAEALKFLQTYRPTA